FQSETRCSGGTKMGAADRTMLVRRKAGISLSGGQQIAQERDAIVGRQLRKFQAHAQRLSDLRQQRFIAGMRRGPDAPQGAADEPKLARSDSRELLSGEH